MIAATKQAHGWPWVRGIGWRAAAALLLTPAVAMRFTNEVRWDAFDFVFMGVLLGGVGLGLELVFRKAGNTAYRAGACVALATIFFLIYLNGAVGIIGGDGEDANVVYGGVILVVLAGAIAARFRAAGMARTMGAAALAQIVVPMLALLVWPALQPVILSQKLFVLSAGFTGLWLLSAALFHWAARRAA